MVNMINCLHSGDEWCLLCVKELRERAESAEDALRMLAGYLGVGGRNAAKVDANVFYAKIRDGIDMAREDYHRERMPLIRKGTGEL